jgi:hypothetical protein
VTRQNGSLFETHLIRQLMIFAVRMCILPVTVRTGKKGPTDTREDPGGVKPT